MGEKYPLTLIECKTLFVLPEPMSCGVAEAGRVFREAPWDLWPIYPSMDAPTRLQELITKLHCLLLEQATSGEIENRFFVAILKLHS